jgi:Animal haem peroxidase
MQVHSVGGHGIAAPRGQEATAGGRFGRLFGFLAARDPGPDALDALVTLIEQADERATENDRIPAGYTYLGQFIDHDITFDPVSRLQRRNDPHALRNFRTPRFDLDSVYGSGPADQPFLFDWSEPDGGVRLLIGGTEAVPDLPRNHVGRALLGDARNDENLLVAQLHLLMLRFHNRVVDVLREREEWPDRWELFEEAQRLVRWHYQWLVVHDYLERVAGREAASAPPRWFQPQGEPAIPLEFSGAAFRFGHSMVRSDYLLAESGQVVPLFARPGSEEHLGGFRPLPASLVVDWSFLFSDFPSMRMDRRLAAPLRALPPDGASLPRLNLERAVALGLPSGPDVARAMGLEPLGADDLLLDRLDPRTREALVRATPLWYYVLCEARSPAGLGGLRLGPVGATIVAEVLVGLLAADPHSYLRQWPAWTPGQGGLPGITDDFTMVDLVRFTR